MFFKSFSLLDSHILRITHSYTLLHQSQKLSIYSNQQLITIVKENTSKTGKAGQDHN